MRERLKKKNQFLYGCSNVREKGREKRKKKKKNSNISLRSLEFRRSEFVGPRTKVYLLDEGYTWVPKIHDFTKDSSDEFGKSKVLGLESVNTGLPRVSSMLQEEGIVTRPPPPPPPFPRPPSRRMKGRETILGLFTCFFRHWWAQVL